MQSLITIIANTRASYFFSEMFVHCSSEDCILNSVVSVLFFLHSLMIRSCYKTTIFASTKTNVCFFPHVSRNCEEECSMFKGFKSLWSFHWFCSASSRASFTSSIRVENMEMSFGWRPIFWIWNIQQKRMTSQKFGSQFSVCSLT